jgi:hypothetical protein
MDAKLTGETEIIDNAVGTDAVHPWPQDRLASVYRPPAIVVLGRALDLLRQSSTGHLIDGTGGWWVWGS